MPSHLTPAAARIRAAEEARDDLRDALTAAGITLPSLGLDPVGLARAEPLPLVELGRCTPELARRIAEVVRRGCGS
jgi:hypothetical protein